jgi:hypothetical protein
MLIGHQGAIGYRENEPRNLLGIKIVRGEAEAELSEIHFDAANVLQAFIADLHGVIVVIAS